MKRISTVKDCRGQLISTVKECRGKNINALIEKGCRYWNNVKSERILILKQQRRD